MSGGTRLLAIIVGAVVVIAAIAGVAIYLQRGQETGPPGPLVTPGGWPASERAAFINSCVDKCRAAPGVTPERYPMCDRACKCAADEAEKTMTVEEMASAAQAISSGKASAAQAATMEDAGVSKLVSVKFE